MNHTSEVAVVILHFFLSFKIVSNRSNKVKILIEENAREIILELVK